MLLSEALKMAEEINNELIAREEAAREREAGEPDYPAFDKQPESDAKRIAKLEARVAAFEAELALLKSIPRQQVIQVEPPDYLKPPFIVT